MAPAACSRLSAPPTQCWAGHRQIIGPVRPKAAEVAETLLDNISSRIRAPEAWTKRFTGQ